MTFDEIVKSRRSIRKYQDKPVSDADLTAVLEAGRMAPSARNAQDWFFTAVRNADTREKLAAACCEQSMVAEAPVTLVVWHTQNRTMQCGQPVAAVDTSIALTFMMLKATELGLGTCWLGAFHEAEVRALLGLPADAVLVAVTPLGWPDEQPAARPRKPAGEVYEVRQ